MDALLSRKVIEHQREEDDLITRCVHSSTLRVLHLVNLLAGVFLLLKQAFIIDMGSTNGTFVNGVKVRSHGVAGMKWAYQFREGDQVRFGQLSYVLQNPQKR